MNYIFLFRFNTDVRNNHINNRLIQVIKEEHRHKVKFNENSRCVLDLSVILKNRKRKLTVSSGHTERNFSNTKKGSNDSLKNRDTLSHFS